MKIVAHQGRGGKDKSDELMAAIEKQFYTEPLKDPRVQVGNRFHTHV